MLQWLQIYKELKAPTSVLYDYNNIYKQHLPFLFSIFYLIIMRTWKSTMAPFKSKMEKQNKKKKTKNHPGKFWVVLVLTQP